MLATKKKKTCDIYMGTCQLSFRNWKHTKLLYQNIFRTNISNSCKTAHLWTYLSNNAKKKVESWILNYEFLITSLNERTVSQKLTKLPTLCPLCVHYASLSCFRGVVWINVHSAIRTIQALQTPLYSNNENPIEPSAWVD